MASRATYALCFALLVVIATAADMPGMPGMAAPPAAPPSGSSYTYPSMVVGFLAFVAAAVLV